MPVYKNSENLYHILKLVFQQIQEEDANAAGSVASSKLIYRIRFTDPSAELTINGRSNPIKFAYGNSTLRPDINVEMLADAFHYILLGDLGVRKALGSGQMKVKGPVLKALALADIFHIGQKIYPDIIKSQGLAAE